LIGVESPNVSYCTGTDILSVPSGVIGSWDFGVKIRDKDQGFKTVGELLDFFGSKFSIRGYFWVRDFATAHAKGGRVDLTTVHPSECQGYVTVYPGARTA
jgi:hypothetical protein